MAGVDYRFLKEFKGAAIDAQGKPHDVAYTMFVRDVERGVVLDFEPIGALLDARQVGQQSAPSAWGECRLMKMQRRLPRSGGRHAGAPPAPGLT